MTDMDMLEVIARRLAKADYPWPDGCCWAGTAGG